MPNLNRTDMDLVASEPCAICDLPKAAHPLAGMDHRHLTKAKADMDAVIRATASLYLGVHTLEEQRSDELDFHDLSVGSIRAALAHAYTQGRLDGATRN